MVSFLDFEGTDPVSASREAADAITAARTDVEQRGVKAFLFASASAEEFDQRAEFSEVPDILDEVADKYLGSPDQRAKLTATLRREFVAQYNDRASEIKRKNAHYGPLGHDCFDCGSDTPAEFYGGGHDGKGARYLCESCGAGSCSTHVKECDNPDPETGEHDSDCCGGTRRVCGYCGTGPLVDQKDRPDAVESLEDWSALHNWGPRDDGTWGNIPRNANTRAKVSYNDRDDSDVQRANAELAQMRGDVFQVMGPNVRTYVHPNAGCSADGQEQVVDSNQTALGAGPVCPRCQVRFAVKPEKTASDPCGGCPAGTKCVCTHDGCRCVKTSSIKTAEIVECPTCEEEMEDTDPECPNGHPNENEYFSRGPGRKRPYGAAGLAVWQEHCPNCGSVKNKLDDNDEYNNPICPGCDPEGHAAAQTALDARAHAEYQSESYAERGPNVDNAGPPTSPFYEEDGRQQFDPQWHSYEGRTAGNMSDYVGDCTCGHRLHTASCKAPVWRYNDIPGNRQTKQCECSVKTSRDRVAQERAKTSASKLACTMCEQPVENLRDDASRKEASLSGLCQGCQDAYFGKTAKYDPDYERDTNYWETVPEQDDDPACKTCDLWKSEHDDAFGPNAPTHPAYEGMKEEFGDHKFEPETEEEPRPSGKPMYIFNGKGGEGYANMCPKCGSMGVKIDENDAPYCEWCSFKAPPGTEGYHATMGPVRREKQSKIAQDSYAQLGDDDPDTRNPIDNPTCKGCGDWLSPVIKAMDNVPYCTECIKNRGVRNHSNNQTISKER